MKIDIEKTRLWADVRQKHLNIIVYLTIMSALIHLDQINNVKVAENDSLTFQFQTFLAS